MGFRSFLSSVIGLTLVSLFVIACGTPRIIGHPQPALTMDEEIFRTSDSPVIEQECPDGVYPEVFLTAPTWKGKSVSSSRERQHRILRYLW